MRPRSVLVLLACLLAGLLLVALDPAGWFAAPGDRPGRSPGAAEGLGADGAGGPRLAGRDGADAAADPASARPPLYGPDDWPPSLAAADRERDLFGLVLDASGRALPGARVRTQRYPWRVAGALTTGRYLDAEPGPAGVTGPDGAFVLRLVPGAVVDLVVEAEGFAAVALRDRTAGERVRVVLGPGVVVRLAARTSDGAPAVGVRVEAGTYGPARASLVTDAAGRAESAPLPWAGSVDVEVPAQPGWSWRSGSHPVPAGASAVEVALTVERAGTLRGRVTDAATGRPIAGASVGLGWTHEVPVRTDGEGRYEHTGVPGDGYHDLSVRAAGYATAEVRFRGRPEGPLDVALATAATLTGRVVDGAGRPLAGARVLATGSRFDGAEQRVSIADTASGADGRFRLEGLSADLPHEVVVALAGHGRVNLAVPALGPPGAARDLGDVPLGPGRALAGRVTGPAGGSRPGATVTLEGPLEGLAAEGPRYGREEERRADDLGRYRFDDLAPGRYRLSARETDALQATREVLLEEADRLDEVLTLPATRRLRLVPLDPAGRTLLDLHVELRWPGGSEERGIYRERDLALQLPAETLGLRVRAEAPDREDLAPPPPVLVPDDADEVELRFTALDLVGGRLEDAEGQPLDGAQVEVRRAGSEERLGASYTLDDGRFEVGFRGPGPVDVVFEGARWGGADGSWQLLRDPLGAQATGVASGTRDLRLVARPTAAQGVLRVRVLAPDGAPAAGVQGALSPRPAALRDARPVGSDAEGGLGYRDLPPGAYTLTLRVPDERRLVWFARPLEGARPRAPAYEVRLVTPRLLAVRVLHPDGSPAADVSVAASTADDEEQRAVAFTDAEGRARLALDPEGPALVDLEVWARRTDGGMLRAVQVDARVDAEEVLLRLAPFTDR